MVICTAVSSRRGGRPIERVMGDVLRRLLYPLVPPAILACVWAHAWAMKQEPGHTVIPPEAVAAATDTEPSQSAMSPRSGYGFSADDAFASTDEE